MAQQISTNTFGVAKWVVSADATQGTHTTIAAALTSSSSGDTIYIRDGSYTENLTLKAGVTLTSFSSNLLSPNVIIIGNATAPATGTVTIAGIGLQTNSAALLTLSGTSTATVNLIDCNINCSNNTGITFSSSDATAKINIERCYGNIGTTGIALFAQSATGALNINYTTINNTGNSTTANTQSAGQLTIDSSYIYSPITTSSTTAILKILNSRIDTSATNTTCITHGSTNATASNILLSFIASGSASSISVSASASLILSICTVSSTNTNAITGAGTITYSDITFIGTSLKINTTTQVGGLLQGGVTQAPSAGFIGEQIRSAVGSGSPVTINNATATNITSISLTAGIWDVSCVGAFNATAITGTICATSISTTSATNGTSGDNLISSPTLPTTSSNQMLTIPSYRITLTTTTTVYLVSQMNYTVGAGTGYGRISATRVG